MLYTGPNAYNEVLFRTTKSELNCYVSVSIIILCGPQTLTITLCSCAHLQMFTFRCSKKQSACKQACHGNEV